MVIAADTSFLFSLYGNDSNTNKAVEWSQNNVRAIAITPFNRFELINSLRFAEFCHRIHPGQADLFFSHFQVDLKRGRLIEQSCSLHAILDEGNRLSATYTLTGGHRAFDILHVAASKVMRATHFLTFDSNQKRLAENEGLIVPF